MEYISIHAAFLLSLPCNFLFFLVMLLIIGPPAYASQTSTPLCLFNQSSALLQFKRSINLSTDELSSWNGSNCCHWKGVTCDSLSGFVTALRMPNMFYNNAYNGDVVLDSLFELKHLRVLDLPNNGFDGTIPKRLAELTHLTYLDLSYCHFSGEVPLTEISQLTRLVYLDLSGNNMDLSGNNIYGTVVESILQLRSLSYIDLSWNNLSHIPKFFQNFTSLQVLKLVDCGLVGSLPSGIFLLPKLQILDLRYNIDLVAFLPKAIPSSSNFRYLDLTGARKVNGDLLPLSNLTKLMHLHLWGCAINGSIPSSWASKHIAVVDLSANFLTGSIPEGICSFSNLTELDLSKNFLSGMIPSCLLNISHLQELDLSQNHLSSDISSFYFNLPSINFIDLSQNHLSSNISSFYFNLPSINFIDFSQNHFSGSIHSSFFNLPSLNYLYLDDNQLSGEISATTVNLTSLWELSLSNNMLTGSIPLFLLNLTSLQKLNLSNNKFNGSVPNFNQFSALEFLLLRNNCLSGDIPSSIAQLSKLREADFSSNCFSESTLFPFFGLNDLQLLNFSHNKRLKMLESSNCSDSSRRISGFLILDLSWCNIKSFPKFLENLDPVFFNRLDLSNNDIRGNIPSYLWGNFGNFSVGLGPAERGILILDHNKIEGFEAINRSSITNSLTYFSVYDNHIIGEIPTFICNFTSLKVLDMSNNYLTGTIPKCLGGMDLQVIGLGSNQLRGKIPAMNSSSVAMISLSNNFLSGKIDRRALYKCTDLQVLDMGDNQLNDTFPFWLSSYVNLKVLILRSNLLHGPITLSGSTHKFSSLHIFDISGNHFFGSLPHELFKNLKSMMANESKGDLDDENDSDPFLDFRQGYPPISDFMGCSDCYESQFTSYLPAVVQTIKRMTLLLPKIRRTLIIIDLSNNMFTNQIPEEIGMLKGLYILNISNNNLSGRIPKSLGNVKAMEALDLSHNHLSGVIPVELSALTFLAVLNLSYNQLYGKIPEGKQFNTFDETSFEGNPSLCGSQVHRQCSISERDNDGVHQQVFIDKDGDEKEKQWEYGALGFGFAVGILLIVVPIMLSERFSSWYWIIIDRVAVFLMQNCDLQKAFKHSRQARRFG